MSDDEVTMAVTQFEARSGERFVTLVRKQRTEWSSTDVDDEVTRVTWDLYDPLTQATVATFDDDLLPAAQQAAVRYLLGQLKVERMRAEANAAENEVLAEFRRPGDSLLRARHFHLEDSSP